MSNAVLDEFHTLISKLEEEEHALAEKFRTAFDTLKAKLTGDAKPIEAAVETVAHDAETVAHDAETAAKPVVEEAVHDGETVAAEAAADVAKDA